MRAIGWIATIAVVVFVLAALTVRPSSTTPTVDKYRYTYVPPANFTYGASAGASRWIDDYGLSYVNITATAGKSSGVSDLTIECIYRGGSGTEVARRVETIYEVVPAGKTKTFNRVRLGFVPQGAKTISCSLLRATQYGPKIDPPVEKPKAQPGTCIGPDNCCVDPENPHMCCSKTATGMNCRRMK
jgi:hypothetical protein